MMREYVSDTGPLISFERIPGGFALLRRLVGGIIVPPQVIEELVAVLPLGTDYLAHYGIGDFVHVETAPPPPPATDGLDDGERHALSLAIAWGLPLLIEERQGREVAAALGLETSGAVGLLMHAWRSRIISAGEAERHAQALLHGRRINHTLLDALLAQLRAH